MEIHTINNRLLSPIILIYIGGFLTEAQGEVFNNKFIIQLQKIDEKVAEKLNNVDQMVSIFVTSFPRKHFWTLKGLSLDFWSQKI